MIWIMPFMFWIGVVDQINNNIALVEHEAGHFVEVDVEDFLDCNPAEGELIFVDHQGIHCK